MATSTYLKADPLKGEATDSAHTEWLEISSFGFGVSQPTSSPGGTLGNQARADFHVFSVSKPSVPQVSISYSIVLKVLK